MAEHDDELDRRITALLGLAQHDAPQPLLAPLPAPRRTGRWLAAAAAVLLVVAAGTALALRDGNDNVASVVTTVPGVDSTVGETTAVVPSTASTVPTEPRDCSAPAVDAYDSYGTMHTIVESSQALEIELVALDAPWCPGGTGVVRVTATNVGAGQERLDPIHLILNGGMNKYTLVHDDTVDEAGGLSLAPGTGMTVEYHVLVPAAPPGSYSLQVYGFGPGTDVRIDGPAACTTDHLSAVAGSSDGAGGKVMTPITVINTGTTPCFLGKPLIVMGTDAGGTGDTQIPFDDGGYFAADDSRPSRVLKPGGSTTMVLTTDDSCLDDTVSYWSTLQVTMDPLLPSSFDVALGPDSRVQTQCGLFISGWAPAT